MARLASPSSAVEAVKSPTTTRSLDQSVGLQQTGDKLPMPHFHVTIQCDRRPNGSRCVVRKYLGKHSPPPASRQLAVSITRHSLVLPIALTSMSPITKLAALLGLLPLLASAQTYTASFTEYGSTDSWGSGNCNVATTACGFYTSPGYSAAVSQNVFGVGPGAGAGPACGGCWSLTGKTDSSGNALSAPKTIVVKVTNLCPAAGNPLCAMGSTSDTNQYGANVNFDLCIDSGASDAFLSPSGVGLAVGTATKVDCSEWSGSQVG